MSEKEKEWDLVVGKRERLDNCVAFNWNQLLNFNFRWRAFNTNVETQASGKYNSFSIFFHNTEWVPNQKEDYEALLITQNLILNP